MRPCHRLLRPRRRTPPPPSNRREPRRRPTSDVTIPAFTSTRPTGVAAAASLRKRSRRFPSARPHWSAPSTNWRSCCPASPRRRRRQATSPAPASARASAPPGSSAVNGLRSRANNFTVDGSDNNDEDIGVRRQGFLALVPQPVESIKEYQVTTLLAPAQYGRNFGAQVNAVSKSGGNEYARHLLRLPQHQPVELARLLRLNQRRLLALPFKAAC